MLIAKAYEDCFSKEIMLFINNGFVVKRFNYVDKNICREYECVDVRELGLTLPGFIDIHVHLRGLNLAYKEDEESGTKAAARGGFTAVVDMPNTLPRIDRPEHLNLKLEALKTKSYTDFGVYVFPANSEILEKMLSVEGVVGVKLFPEDIQNLPTVVETMAKKWNKKIVIIHAENEALLGDCEPGFRWSCRPIESEISALNTVYSLYVRSGVNVKVHITHVTNVLTLSLSKRYGFTADSCPHYLYLDANAEESLGCIAKVNPPLRQNSSKEMLVKMIKALDAISTDHAPHALEEKMVSFDKCPSGIASIDIAASLILNLVSKNVISLDDVVRLLSLGPAHIIGLKRWGCFYSGCLASYTVVDINEVFSVCSENFFSKARFSPYEGYTLRGAVKATIVRGHIVYREDEIQEKVTPMPITRFTRS